MLKTFSEVVVNGSFSVVKGFVLGFLSTRHPDARYYFYQKSGIIRHDSLAGLLKDYLELEQSVYLCLEDTALDDFYRAVEWATPKIGISIREKRPVYSAEVKFSFKIFNRELAERCKSIFDEIPDGVEIRDFAPHERYDENAPEYSFTGSSHPYSYLGSGCAFGSFDGIIQLFLQCKRSQCSEFITCSEVKLLFDEPVPV